MFFGKNYSVTIDSSKYLDENLDIFNKLVQDITKAVVLLNGITKAYRDVKTTLSMVGTHCP